MTVTDTISFLASLEDVLLIIGTDVVTRIVVTQTFLFWFRFRDRNSHRRTRNRSDAMSTNTPNCIKHEDIDFSCHTRRNNFAQFFQFFHRPLDLSSIPLA